MANEILSYVDMCVRESASLQRGMNFDHGAGYSVILMSVRANAQYRDRFEDDGSTLIYEGHDSPRSKHGPDPKTMDQPSNTPSGKTTQNGKFHDAAQRFKASLSQPILMRVYEKIHAGIWSYNGVFQLTDSWQVSLVHERSSGHNPNLAPQDAIVRSHEVQRRR